MGASESSESGSQTYLVAPLFLTIAGMIVAIPVICLIINCLHKRRVRQAAASSPSSASAAAPGFQSIPASWQKLFKHRSREEWSHLASIKKSSTASDKDADVEMGDLDKVHLAPRNNVKGRVSPNRGAALSSTALPKSLDDGINNDRKSQAYGTLKTPTGDLGRSESQKTYNSAATTITPDLNRSASTRTTASKRLPSIWPDEDGYYRPKLAPSPSTASKSTRKPNVNRHLDSSLYATAESPPDLPPLASLPVKEVSSRDIDKAGEANDKGNESLATNLRTTHKPNERLQKDPPTRHGDDLTRSATDKSMGTVKSSVASSVMTTLASADGHDDDAGVGVGASAGAGAGKKGKGSPNQQKQNQNRNRNQTQKRQQKPSQDHDQKSEQDQNDKQSQKQDITEAFNLQRQQSKARKQRELDEILGPPTTSFAGTGTGSSGGPVTREVVAGDEDEHLAFSHADIHGRGQAHAHGVGEPDLA